MASPAHDGHETVFACSGFRHHVCVGCYFGRLWLVFGRLFSFFVFLCCNTCQRDQPPCLGFDRS